MGSTTYPGLQLTAWALFEGFKQLGKDVSLNDVCVFIPAGFGAVARCAEAHRAQTESITTALTAPLRVAVCSPGRSATR